MQPFVLNGRLQPFRVTATYLVTTGQTSVFLLGTANGYGEARLSSLPGPTRLFGPSDHVYAKSESERGHSRHGQ